MFTTFFKTLSKVRREEKVASLNARIEANRQQRMQLKASSLAAQRQLQELSKEPS